MNFTFWTISKALNLLWIGIFSFVMLFTVNISSISVDDSVVFSSPVPSPVVLSETVALPSLIPVQPKLPEEVNRSISPTVEIEHVQVLTNSLIEGVSQHVPVAFVVRNTSDVRAQNVQLQIEKNIAIQFPYDAITCASSVCSLGSLQPHEVRQFSAEFIFSDQYRCADFSPLVLHVSSQEGSAVSDQTVHIPCVAGLHSEKTGFTIVVINEKGREAVLNGIYNRTIEMTRSFEPWRTYAPYIHVIQIKNTTKDLGCTGSEFVVCTDDVLNMVQHDFGHPETDVVIVAIGAGERSTGEKNVIYIGSSASAGTIAHELGHAVGNLQDEYVYGPEVSVHESFLLPGPNCFATKQACETAIAPYGDNTQVMCIQGCTTGSLWRTTKDSVMNSSAGLESGTYGPVGMCVMAKSLEASIKKQVPDFVASTHFCGRS